MKQTFDFDHIKNGDRIVIDGKKIVWKKCKETEGADEMKLLSIGKHKNCSGCEALNDNRISDFYCQLGYKTKLYDTHFKGISLLQPIEPCPKPKNYKDFIFCNKNLRKEQTK